MPTTKTYMTWKFEEASEELKQKIYDRYRYFNVEDDFWYDYDGKTGFTQDEIERMGLKLEDVPDELLRYKKIYFDIDRSWYIQFVDAEFLDDEIARKFLGVSKELWENTIWEIEDCPHRNSSTRLTYKFNYYDFDEQDDFTDEEIVILDKAVEIFEDKIEEALRHLRDNYEYQCSDEAIADTMIVNDYDFDENGRIS